MSFSDMTNVVYKWRIKDFIEKLKNHLAFDEDRNKIYCYKEEIKDELELEPEKRNYHRVKEIHVERSDTDTASNYVICSSICQRMQQEQCFSGDRVGVLVQGNGILEEDKDSEKQIDLFYSIGEIIHIGVNQAIYLAEEKRLKTGDIAAAQNSIKTTEQIDKPDSMITIKQRDEIIHAVKGYVRNRGVIIYPNNSVYVKREKNKLKYIDLENVLQEKPVFQENDICSCSSRKIECLYHKTLEILRYVNGIVVDISNNSLQCLFWLGAAHGSSVNAITVLHEATEKELEKTTGFREKKIRTVFDVVGLWIAILHSNDTEGFYRQLAQAQYGIEQHSKLMMKNRKMHEKKLHDGILKHLCYYHIICQKEQ